ncbi:hypothetical protein [Microbacterium sp. 77mftsu3.1]|uniref:hypothetical protein n=1 Tax=Microbacterium sp. 77mftsu3.1 TaxID=1761802 RepID=UPI0003702A89|nr:hypothetical protein [Microbacterium sp. 77mftsu3.1]SDH41857.1 hypothetical protein SAMN04488590_3291 [Microbacterium sp. 77mftsu3.1]
MVESNPSTPTPTIEELEAAVVAADTVSRDAEEAATDAIAAAIEASRTLSAARRTLKDARIAEGLEEENPVARSVKNTAHQLRAMADTVESGKPGVIKPGVILGLASVVEGLLPVIDLTDLVVSEVRDGVVSGAPGKGKTAKDADQG